MHPLSTLLFILGYGLAIPVAFRMTQVVSAQHRLALTGHQVGVLFAGVGWLLRGRIILALVHLVWAIGVKLWFATRAGSSA